jgi:hypothetical protein
MNKKINPETMTIGVVGAGSWGTALANLLAVKGFAVDHWVYEAEVKAQMLAEKENRRFLPGIILSPNLQPSGDLESVVAGKGPGPGGDPFPRHPPDDGDLRPRHWPGYGCCQCVQGD